MGGPFWGEEKKKRNGTGGRNRGGTPKAVRGGGKLPGTRGGG